MKNILTVLLALTFSISFAQNNLHEKFNKLRLAGTQQNKFAKSINEEQIIKLDSMIYTSDPSTVHFAYDNSIGKLINYVYDYEGEYYSFFDDKQLKYSYNRNLVVEININKRCENNLPWIDSLKYQYTYTANNNIFEITKYEFFENSWQESLKVNYEYNEENKIENEFFYEWDLESQAWILFQKAAYDYSNEADTVLIMGYKIENNSIVREIYKYYTLMNEEGDYLYTSYYIKPQELDEWEGQYVLEHILNSDNLITEIYFYNWMGDNEWIEAQKILLFYDENINPNEFLLPGTIISFPDGFKGSNFIPIKSKLTYVLDYTTGSGEEEYELRDSMLFYYSNIDIYNITNHNNQPGEATDTITHSIEYCDANYATGIDSAFIENYAYNTDSSTIIINLVLYQNQEAHHLSDTVNIDNQGVYMIETNVYCNNRSFQSFKITDYITVQNLSVSKLSELNINLYPNPCNNDFYVNIDTKNTVISIYTITGKFVKSKNLQKGDNKINISELPVGTYIYVITNPNTFKSGKIVKL